MGEEATPRQPSALHAGSGSRTAAISSEERRAVRGPRTVAGKRPSVSLWLASCLFSFWKRQLHRYLYKKPHATRGNSPCALHPPSPTTSLLGLPLCSPSSAPCITLQPLWPSLHSLPQEPAVALTSQWKATAFCQMAQASPNRTPTSHHRHPCCPAGLLSHSVLTPDSAPVFEQLSRLCLCPSNHDFSRESPTPASESLGLHPKPSLALGNKNAPFKSPSLCFS